MQINKSSMLYLLAYVFSIYDDRFDQMPDFTEEGFKGDIENMKAHARNSGELLELRLTLEYIQTLDFDAMQDFIPNNEHFEEEEDIRMLLQLALESDWQELVSISNYKLSDVIFIDVPLQEWRPMKIKENQTKR